VISVVASLVTPNLYNYLNNRRQSPSKSLPVSIFLYLLPFNLILRLTTSVAGTKSSCDNEANLLQKYNFGHGYVFGKTLLQCALGK
jgi:hypothetical protein